MRPELQNKLYEDFPSLYREKDKGIQESCMPWGFQCGAGWEPIIRKLSEMLKRIEELTGHQAVASQVKEKFGTLTFDHYTIPPDEAEADPIVCGIIDACVSITEQRSAWTCESCGEFGELRKEGGWLTTLCTEHHRERLARL